MKASQLALVVALSGATELSALERPRSLDAVEHLVREGVEAAPGVRLRTGAPDDATPRSLDVEQAVGIALTRNPGLLARMEELGISEADVQQAGLLPNPTGHVAIRFPAGGGAEGTGHEAGLHMDLFALWARADRKKMAKGQLEQAKLRLAHEVMKLALDVKGAFYSWQAKAEHLALRATMVDSLKTEMELAARQRQAGNLSDLELAMHRAAYHESVLELRDDEAETATAREEAHRLLGVQGTVGWSPRGFLASVPGDDPDLAAIEARAVASRWDLAAARREPAVLAHALRLAKLEARDGWAIGIDGEKDSDGEQGLGPDIDFVLPIFDKRQAAKARVESQVRQSRQQMASLEQEVRFEVRSAWEKLRAARLKVRTYEDDLIPLKRKIVDEMLLRYNFMLEGVYELLAAKRGELEARQGAIEARRTYWTTRAELERAVGGRLAGGDER